MFTKFSPFGVVIDVPSKLLLKVLFFTSVMKTSDSFSNIAGCFFCVESQASSHFIILLSCSLVSEPAVILSNAFFMTDPGTLPICDATLSSDTFQLLNIFLYCNLEFSISFFAFVNPFLLLNLVVMSVFIRFLSDR